MSNGTRNLGDLDRSAFKVNPEDPSDVSRKVCDTEGNALLQQIADNIGGNCETYTAGETLSAVKAVYISAANTVSLGQKTTKPEACVIGITKCSANTGETIEVQLSGEMTDSSFNYNAGDVLYLDLNGNLTTTPPTTGSLTVVGKALGNCKILIRIEEPIIL